MNRKGLLHPLPMSVESRPLIKSGRLFPLVFALTLSFGFSLWHRTQVSIEALDGRLTGNDAYLYFRQMERIVEEGKLPKRDMERWLPLGRNLSLSHNLYPYAVAHSHLDVRRQTDSLDRGNRRRLTNGRQLSACRNATRHAVAGDFLGTSVGWTAHLQ